MLSLHRQSFIHSRSFFVTTVHWAYKKEDSWSEIPMEISLKMEKAYGRNKQGSIIVELEGNM